MGWKDALSLGSNQSDTELDARMAGTKPGHCAALIYTSGTTGDPKAVMISHDNITYVANTIFGLLGKSCGVAATSDEERVLSYLPLSHIAGLAVDVVGQVAVGALTPASSAI